MANPAKIMRREAVPGGPMAVAPMLNPFFGLLPPELWNKEKSFFIYGTDYNTIATAATVTNNIAVQADSDFLLAAACIAVQAFTAGATATGSFAGTVIITDAGSGRNLMNQAIHVANVYGTAQLPAYWPFPYLVKRNSTLQTQLANLDTTNAYVIRIAYWGFKIFG